LYVSHNQQEYFARTKVPHTNMARGRAWIPPDLYFGSKKLAVFIDGCFWHHCPKCFVKPKSNNDYWDAKMARNKKRDRQVNRLLKAESITVMRFWEHDIKKNPEKCLLKLQTALL
jgi:DNA mismatch endonuclease (patch repair protein)